MFGLPLWALFALLNLVAVVWWATSFLRELQVTDEKRPLGTLAVRLLAVLVVACLGVSFVVGIAFGRALASRRQRREDLARPACPHRSTAAAPPRGTWRGT